MGRAAMFAFSGAAWLVAGGAFAGSCEERLAALEVRLDEAAKLSISASSGGQGVASSREAQAMEVVEESDEVVEPVVPYQEDDEEGEAVERAEEAGEGGDLVMQARALAEEARASAEEGNDAACEEALSDAAELLNEVRPASEEEES